MKILIAGLGSIGRRHLRNLQALGEEDILLYRTHFSTLPEDELVGLPVETDLEAALAEGPQAVIVANPTALHLEVAIPAAQAGCHLLIEKPVSHSMDRVDDLVAAAASSGSQVLVGYHYRYHPGLMRIRELLAQAAIGDVVAARVHWGEYLPDWHPWEDYRQSYCARRDLGGGVVPTLSHPLDYLRWLIGEMSAVWAFTIQTNQLGLDVEDTAEIGLRFASGSLGSVHLDYVQRPHTHWLEIIGTQGSLRWDNSDGTARMYRAVETGWKVFPPPEGFQRNDMYLEEMRHFIQVVRGEASPVCTLQDGILALQVCLAVHRSAEAGRVVNLRDALPI